MRFLAPATLMLVTLFPARTLAAQAEGTAAIVAAAKDYIEGWYEGDAARMTRALHPELVKRIHGWDSTTKRWWISNQGASNLIFGTARGGGSKTPREKRRTDVKVLDVFRNASSVRIDADEWVDYLQLVREGDRWLIVNVLWELRGPEP